MSLENQPTNRQPGEPGSDPGIFAYLEVAREGWFSSLPRQIRELLDERRNPPEPVETTAASDPEALARMVETPSPFSSIRRQFLELYAEFRNPPPRAEITATPDPGALENLIEPHSVVISIVRQVRAIVDDARHPTTVETTAAPIEVKPLWSMRRLHRPAGVLALILIVAFFGLNPDFLRSQPRRVIRIAGQAFDQDRFVLRELLLPPELVPVPEPLPQIAENLPPGITVPLPEAPPPPPPSESEPTPPPELEPPAPPLPEALPPTPVLGPDDVIAEGARPDADPAASEGDTLEPPDVTENGTGDFAIEEIGEAGEPGEVGEGGEDVEAEPEAEAAEEASPLAENTNPRALTLPDFGKRAESIIDEQMERRRQESASGRRPGTQRGVQELPNFSTEEPTILSDTRGYDFGPYMNQVINRVRVNWYSLIPETARLGRRGRVVIIFTILKRGGVDDMRIVANSDAEPLDRSAMAAIQASNPFPPLPSDFDSDHIVLQFTFMYNMR